MWQLQPPIKITSIKSLRREVFEQHLWIKFPAGDRHWAAPRRLCICYICVCTIFVRPDFFLINQCIGLASVIHKDILLGGGMFNSSRQMQETPLERFDDFLQSLWWPADVGRVRTRVNIFIQHLPCRWGSQYLLQLGTGGGKVKADEWRNTMLVYPVALFQAWRVGDSFPDGDAPLPSARSKVKATEEHTAELGKKRRKKNAARQTTTTVHDYDAIEATGASRNYQDHYLNVLRFCTASRVIVTRAISPNEASRARTFLSEAFSSWSNMNCLLTPNFHLAMHTDLFISAFGPAYAWWVFPFERHLGRLGRFKTNGHSGGELEATMMRSWWKTIYCQDLVSVAFASISYSDKLDRSRCCKINPTARRKMI